MLLFIVVKIDLWMKSKKTQIQIEGERSHSFRRHSSSDPPEGENTTANESRGGVRGQRSGGAGLGAGGFTVLLKDSK